MSLRFAVEAGPETPEPFLADQARLLESVAVGVSLPEVLRATAEALEAHCEDLRCSIHLADAAGALLEIAAAPSLSPEWREAAARVPIGPASGACGTAAHRRQRVIVTDTASDPLFAAYRETAVRLGLRACWSTPVLGADGGLIGTVAVYLEEPREPSGREASLIDAVTNLVAIAAQRERWREEVRASEERLRAIIDNEPECVKLVSPDGVLLDINPAGLAMVEAQSRGEVVGSRILDLIEPIDRERYQELHERVCRGGRGVAEFRIRGLRGTARWMETHSAPLREASGAVAGVLSVTRDVTERKRLEGQVLNAQRLESLGTLAGGIAHEFNNLLAPIVLAVETLHRRTDDADARRLLGTIGDSAARGAELVRQVLAFARGGSTVERRELDVAGLLRETADLARELFPKAIRVEVDAPAGLRVSGDAGRLGQALMSLLVNARDAMPGGGLLRLSARSLPESGEVVVAVADQGSGIPLEIRDRIFDPFFTTKDVGQGTGLGLSTTLAIAKGHGGRLEVDSAPGAGTTVRLYLPARARDAGDPAPAAPPPLAGRRTVLLIDDEPALLEVTAETLEGLGYEVLAAPSAASALEIFRTHRERVSLVLTDMMMPETDGPTLVGRLRELEPSVRVVGVSGLPRDAHALPAGALRGFLCKPYSAEELKRALEGALAR